PSEPLRVPNAFPYALRHALAASAGREGVRRFKETRGTPMRIDAHAFWIRSPGEGEIRRAQVRPPGEGEVLVRTLYSGVSRGTEVLVFLGRVPESQYAAMRAPFQEGDFPGPVKYGYLNVGVVEQGPPGWPGRTVFCLYPHQTRYTVPVEAVTVVPPEVPPARAVLAGTVETAVNALWDAPPLIGDRIAVVGAGIVGCCAARLVARFPAIDRSEEHTSELHSRENLVCRLLLEKKKNFLNYKLRIFML